MKRLILSVIMLQIALMSASCLAVQPPKPDAITEFKDVTLSWPHNTKHADDSELLLSDIAYYEIFYGLVSDPGAATKINAGVVESYTITDLPGGDYQFWIWTVDTAGVQGELSDELLLTVVTQVRPSKIPLEVN